MNNKYNQNDDKKSIYRFAHVFRIKGEREWEWKINTCTNGSAVYSFSKLDSSILLTVRFKKKTKTTTKCSSKQNSIPPNYYENKFTYTTLEG